MWIDAASQNVRFTRYSNSIWNQGDGSTSGSATLGTYSDGWGYDFTLNSSDNPLASWGDWYFYFTKFSTSYLSPATAQSTTVNGLVEDIETATLTATDSTPGASSIDYYLTNDGGTTWHQVQSGDTYSFSSLGSDLRWKAILYKGSVPVLSNINIAYTTPASSTPTPTPTPSTSLPIPNLKEIENIDHNTVILHTEIDDPTYYNQDVTIKIKIHNADSDSTGYQVITKTAGNSGKIKITIKNLKSDTDYDFNVRTQDTNGNASDWSNKKSTQTNRKITDTKNKPTDLGASQTYQGTVLTWSDNAQEENGYLIEKKTDDQPTFIQIATLPKNTETYTDTHTAPEDTATYRVRAYQGDNYTPYSNEVAVGGTTNNTPSTSTDNTNTEGTNTEGTTNDTPQESISTSHITDTPKTSQDTPPTNDSLLSYVLSGTIESIKNFTETNTVASVILILLSLSAGALHAFSSTGIPLLSITPAPLKNTFSQVFSLIGILLKPKKKIHWGIVFDSFTKAPVPYAQVSLVNDKGRILETVATDTSGRYGFLTNEGQYSLEVQKGQYTLKTDQSQDALYGALYTGETLTVEKDTPITLHIALSPEPFNWNDFARKLMQKYASFLSVIKKDSFIILYTVGFLYTIVVSFYFPTAFNLAMAILYILLFLYTLFLKEKSYGTITSTTTQQPIPFAQVSLYDERDENKRITFTITDTLGRYYLLAENGNYLLKVQGRTLVGDTFERSGQVRVSNGILKEDVMV